MALILIRYERGRTVREHYKTHEAAKKRIRGLNEWADCVDVDGDQLDCIELWEEGGTKPLYTQGTKP